MVMRGRGWNGTFRSKMATQSSTTATRIPMIIVYVGRTYFVARKLPRCFLQAYPEAIPANANWKFSAPDTLVSWMGPGGPAVFYFFFCDPDDRNAVCFSGVFAPHVRDVLLKRESLDEYLAVADRLLRPGP
jgi:hypothetical protein